MDRFGISIDRFDVLIDRFDVLIDQFGVLIDPIELPSTSEAAGSLLNNKSACRHS
jgi:hypothetical protein